MYFARVFRPVTGESHVCSIGIIKSFKANQPHVNAPTDITNPSKSAAPVYFL